MAILLTFLLIVSVSFVTRSVILSLGLGLIITSLLANDFSILPAFNLLTSKMYGQLELDVIANPQTILKSWSVFVFCFIYFLGVLIELMQRGGFFQALQHTILKTVKTGKRVEILTLVMSKLFMVDDYLSCLAVGNMMAASFDKFKITRTKLAFLIDSMSAPVALLCPISSWSVIILGIFNSAAFKNSHFAEHFSGNAITQYFYVLPYLFYSFVLVFSCWFIVLKRISFGTIDDPKYLNHSISTSVIKNDVKFKHFLIPFLSLIIAIFLFNLLLGGYHLFGGANSIIVAFQASNSAAALCFASITSTIITIGWMLYSRQITFHAIPNLFISGWKKVYLAILILWLSWSMSSILTGNLNIGGLIIDVIGTDVPINFFPVIFFILSLITGFVTGTSWGTVAIISPIAISVFDSLYVKSGMTIDPQLLMIGIGATISGSISGDHLSPLCSTTVMSASSAGISPIVHAKTQFLYTIPIAAGSLIAFYLASSFSRSGLLISSLACISFAIFISCTALGICSLISRSKSRKETIRTIATEINY